VQFSAFIPVRNDTVWLLDPRHCRWPGAAKMWWMVGRILASPSVALLVAEPETGLA
jgi:hypothetical protein